MKDYQAPPDLLKDRVILITGAGQGIGRTAAISFAAHGATVILHGRKVPKLEAVYDEIVAANYAQPAIFPLDLEQASDKDFEAFATAIEREFGRLDGILHNAVQGQRLSPLDNQSLDLWLQLLRVNLAAPFALTRACFPLLKLAPDATVVFTGESHGHTPAAYWGGFAVAKAGLETLVKICADEWEMYSQLRVNALIPGPVKSPQRSMTHPGEAKDALPSPEDLMPQYLYLMGQDSQGVSGQILSC
jgi:NAD(P)-dependent dehydrogenase (short-subunit alcohol dehydrogenase family)